MATPVNGQANAISKSKQQRPGKQPAQPKKQQQQQSQPGSSGHPRKNARIDPSDDDHSNTDRGRSFYDGSRSARGRSRARSVSRPSFERHRSVGPWQGYASDDGDQDFVRVPRITFEGPGDKRFVRVYDDTMRFDWVLALIRHRCLIDATKPLSLVYSRDVAGDLPVELEDEDDFTGLRALAWEGSDVKITVRGTRSLSAQWPAPPLLSGADAGAPQQRAGKTPLRRSAPQHSTPTVQTSLEPPAKRQKITAIAGDLAASAKKQPAKSGPSASSARSESEESASESAPAADTQASEPDTVLESSAPAPASAPERKRGSRGKNKKGPADDAEAEVEETVPAVTGQKRKPDESGDVDQADAPPKPKRKRRTKAEMEAARAAEAAAKVNSDATVSAGRQDKSIGEGNEAQSEDVANKEAKKAKKLAKEAKKAGRNDAEAENSNLATTAEPLTSKVAADDEAPAGAESPATIPNDDSAASKKLLEKGCAICLSVTRHDIEVCPTILAGRAAVKARVEELKAKKQRKIKPERNAQTELVQWLKNHPASSEKKTKKKAVAGGEVAKVSSKGSAPPTGESTSEPSEAPMSAENDAGRLLPLSLDADGATVGAGTSASPDRIAARTSPSKDNAGSEASAISTKGKKKAMVVAEGSGNGKRKAAGGDDPLPTEALPTSQQRQPTNGIADAPSPLGGDEARTEQHTVKESGQALSHGGGEDSDTSDDSDDDDDAADEDVETPSSAQHTPGQTSEGATSPHSETDTQSSSPSSSDSESDRGSPPAALPQRNGCDSEEEEQDELQATPVPVPEAKGQAVKASSQPAPTPWQRAASLLPFGRSRDSAAFSTSDVVDAPPVQAASQPARKAKPPLLSELSPAHFRKSSFAGSQPNSPLVTPASSAAKAKPPASQLGSPWTSTNGQSTAKANGKIGAGPQSSDGSDDEDSDSDSSDDDDPSTKKAAASVPAARRAGASSSSSLAKKNSNGFFKAFT